MFVTIGSIVEGCIFHVVASKGLTIAGYNMK